MRRVPPEKIPDALRAMRQEPRFVFKLPWLGTAAIEQLEPERPPPQVNVVVVRTDEQPQPPPLELPATDKQVPQRPPVPPALFRPPNEDHESA
jgi:hypothetical protein